MLVLDEVSQWFQQVRSGSNQGNRSAFSTRYDQSITRFQLLRRSHFDESPFSIMARDYFSSSLMQEFEMLVECTL